MIAFSIEFAQPQKFATLEPCIGDAASWALTTDDPAHEGCPSTKPTGLSTRLTEKNLVILMSFLAGGKIEVSSHLHTGRWKGGNDCVEICMLVVRICFEET